MPYTRITLATLRARLQDRWDGSPFWTTADANQALNDALLLWNALTGYWTQRITITEPANDPYAAIPGTMVQGTSVALLGSQAPLTRGSLLGLGCIRPNWRRETTATAGCPSVPTVWAAPSLNMIVVWPAPTVDTQLTIDGIRQTPRLVNDGDFLDCDDTVIGPILAYGLHAAALKAPATILQRTQAQYQYFIDKAVERNQTLRASDWYRRVKRLRRDELVQPHKVPAPDDAGGVSQL